MKQLPTFRPWAGNPNALQHTPGVKMQGATPTAHNMLTEGLKLVFPHRVSERMREGLAEDNSPLTRLTRTTTPLSGLGQLTQPGLSNEQMAEIAIAQAMGRH